jgi:energy-coupling factor transporter ATP-binding protein EcfA2
MSSEAWDQLMESWFSKKDKKAIEWAVGCILVGGPKKILVISGDSATGKSTTINLMTKVVEHCSEKTTLQVAVSHDGFLGVNSGCFMIIADNIPPRNRSERVIEVTTTGKRFSENMFQNLRELAADDPEAIASKCLNTYRRMGGAIFFNQEIN